MYGDIAEASLYLLPPLIVNVFARAIGQEFWETWDSMEIKGYSDVIARKGDIDSEEGGFSVPLYKVIQREDENEFIEYWDDQELKFTDKMKECFEDWKERFEKILPGKNFVTDVLEHKNDVNYQKALLLYKEIIDKDLEYFPELTHRQAIRWIMRESKDEFCYTEMAAFPSLLINRKHRFEILGF